MNDKSQKSDVKFRTRLTYTSMATVVWAAKDYSRVEDVRRVLDLYGVEVRNVVPADLSGYRRPDDIVVIQSGFPYRTILFEYEKNFTPFVVIALDKDYDLPFKSCMKIIDV